MFDALVSLFCHQEKIMKITYMALAIAALCMTTAQAGEFDGGYIGAKIGANQTDMTAVSRQTTSATGLEGGYNWNTNGVLLGVDGFIDFNSKKTHTRTAPTAPASVYYGSHVYGLDMKLGFPSGNWLPYAKLGYAHVGGRGDAYASVIGDSDAHYGLGVEYKFAPQWSTAAEWTGNSGKNLNTRLRNNNFTIGINYYFDEPYVAPAPVAAPVVIPPPVVKIAEPKPVIPPPPPPPPKPREIWKTVLSEKPITIEGTSFDTNSAVLKKAADEKLNEVVKFAARYQDASLVVTGYTDSRGSDKLNMNLSARRAESVKAYLISKGVAADRIVIKGEGSANPVADNKTAKGRAMNRRVEIRSVIKEEKKVRVE